MTGPEYAETGPLAGLQALWWDEEGVSSVEYIFLMAVLSLAAIVAFGHLSLHVQLAAEDGSDALERAAGMGCYNGE